MKTVTLPLPPEILYANDINIQDYQVDISKIDYDDPEMNKEKVNCTLIYLRNIDLPISCDFSKLSYEEKEEWILKYINTDLFNLFIKELSETVISLLVDEPIDNIGSILNSEETIKFQTNHKDLLDNIITFLVSFDDIIFLLLENKDNKTLEYTVAEDFEIIKEKPSYFECITGLLSKYPNYIDAIRLYYTESYTHKFYQVVVDSITTSNDLYQSILSLPSAKLIGSIYSFDIKDE